MENTNLTTKQLLERWKLLVEHKDNGRQEGSLRNKKN